jgi:glycerol-1-phosphatase
MLWVLDLDGVVWLAGRPIPGSANAIATLRHGGEKVAFVTNNSGPTVADYVKRLADAGVPAHPEEIVTSSQAAASMLAPGSRVAFLGGDGLREALEARPVEIVPAESSPETVVVGRSLTLAFDVLAHAASAIRAGARFVATNTDPTFPTPQGLEPGAGALIAYLEVGSGKKAEVAGKPEQAMAALVRARHGRPGVVVGDQPNTDGLFASRLEADFGLVLTGVTKRSDLPVKPRPAVVGDDLGSLVTERLAR